MVFFSNQSFTYTVNDRTRSCNKDHTQVFHLPDTVVAEIEGVQFLQGLQVFDLLDQVLLQIQTSQFSLMVEVLNLPDSVTLEPQTTQTCVLLQVLYLVNACQYQLLLLYHSDILACISGVNKHRKSINCLSNSTPFQYVSTIYTS